MTSSAMPAHLPRFSHRSHYGAAVRSDESYRGKVPADFTMNSPVGVCEDKEGNVWVCDTGNNRVLILDGSLTRIVRILHRPASLPQDKKKRGGNSNFHMPFHVCAHPDDKRMYITDIGNGRVVAMDYADGDYRFAFAFGDVSSRDEKPLQDPNGIVLVKRKDRAGYFIYVNDEFFHTPEDPLRSRCVCFDEAGIYQNEFGSVQDADGKTHDLLWPQGLSADAAGRLYIANTGEYEVLACDPLDRIDAHTVRGSALLPASQDLKCQGTGMFKVMRSVRVLGERVLIPNASAEAVAVFDLDGKTLSGFTYLMPSLISANEQVDSPTDILYYAGERSTLFGPYTIAPSGEKDVYFITEPFASRLLKVRITHLDFDPLVELLGGLGGRRDNPAERHAYPQFNCVTAVAGLGYPAHWPPSEATVQAFERLPDELPAQVLNNPLQHWWLQASRLMMQQYSFWTTPFLNPERLAAPFSLLNMDAGNWTLQTYTGTARRMSPLPTQLSTILGPCSLGMATFHPPTPLLGQLCPGTPIILIGNTFTGLISLYQIGPLGNIMNYGLPFGGIGQDHQMTRDECDLRIKGPQGITVSPEGEIYVADPLLHRISKWRLLPTGQVIFVRHISVEENPDDPDDYIFTPTDVTVDGDGRLLVTDQFNDRICAFDRDGNFLWAWGDSGYWEEGDKTAPTDPKHPFLLPTSLTVDGEHLIVNDLVNRALKLFRIEDKGLSFLGGISLFKRPVEEGGVWMPFFMFAQDKHVYVADTTFNVVQVFSYRAD